MGSHIYGNHFSDEEKREILKFIEAKLDFANMEATRLSIPSSSVRVHITPDGSDLPKNARTGDWTLYRENDWPTGVLWWFRYSDDMEVADYPWWSLGMSTSWWQRDDTTRNITQTGALNTGVPNTALEFTLPFAGNYTVEHTAWLTPPGAAESDWVLSAVGGGGFTTSHNYGLIVYGTGGTATGRSHTRIDDIGFPTPTTVVRPYGEVSGGTGLYLRARMGIKPLRVSGVQGA